MQITLDPRKLPLHERVGNLLKLHKKEQKNITIYILHYKLNKTEYIQLNKKSGIIS